MIKVSLVVSKPYQGNRIFDMENPVNGRDNHLHLFFMLKQMFNQKMVDVATNDINSIQEADIIIYNDMPRVLPRKQKHQRTYLLAMESIGVAPQNFKVSLYKYFDKVFTWNDEVVNNINIVKINYSFLLKPLPYISFNNKKGFLCLVSGNKFSTHAGELYTERVRFIEYMTNQNIAFDLYGIGWDKAYRNISLFNLVKKFHRYKLSRKVWYIFERLIYTLGLKNSFFKKYKSFKGKLSPKIPRLAEYKFNICYENVGNTPGYITEKIFDCFLAGCVPVYLGAPNVHNYIPPNTFIDRRKFKDNKELLNYLYSIKEHDYNTYQNNILRYLKSDEAIIFSSQHTAKKIIEEIQNTY